MDDRLKVALGATLIAAIFAFGAGGNWLVFLVLASMAVLVTWDSARRRSGWAFYKLRAELLLRLS